MENAVKMMNSDVKQNLLILLVGILAVAMGIFAIVSEKTADKKNTEAASAVVVAYEEGEEYNSQLETYDTVYYPVVGFSADGKDVNVAYSQCYSKKEYSIGEEILIHYDPENPQNFTIDGDRRGSFVAVWEIPVGILLIGLAGYRFFKKSKLFHVQKGEISHEQR